MKKYTTNEIKKKFGISPKTSIIDANTVLRQVEKVGRNSWVIKSDKCCCPQGSICEFFDKKERCLYGKI